MSQTLKRPMTADEFLEWDLLQPEGRHELVDGFPVPRHREAFGMTGAAMRHDDIVGNEFAHLWNQLRGHKCRRFTADIAVVTANGAVRRPDVGVRCPPFTDKMTAAPNTVLVVEVLSPSTQSTDIILRLEEYKRVATMRTIVLIDPDEPQVIVWTRATETWSSLPAIGLESVIEVDHPAIRLTLADIYEGLAFPPRLVT